MLLPPAYAWIAKSVGDAGGHPAMLAEAIKLYGVHESPGPGDNPEIVSWAKEAGIRGYVHDSIPWCGLFVAVCAFRAKKPLPKEPLWALNWSTWGNGVPLGSPPSMGIAAPSLGDVLVFIRVGGGHVGMYVGEDSAAYHVLGGNESDQVEITRVLKGRLHAWRRPPYTVVPANVRPEKLAPTGAIGAPEA